MAETLWAPWRMEFILGNKESGCVLCKAGEASPAQREQRLTLHVGQHAFVMLNKYPYSHGHLMIVPRRHVSDLESLTAEERLELMDLAILGQRALKRAMHPQGINLGMNLGRVAGAGIADHLHMHLVPRWEGDTNFMPLLADTRVMPEHLMATYHNLRGAFLALDAQEVR